MNDIQQFEAIVVGGGQAGLATSHELTGRGVQHIVLEADERVGDTWRRRYDSLRLFTPVQYSALPGMPHLMPRGALLTRGEFAAYLERYAETLGLPLRTGVRVRRVTRTRDGFDLETTAGQMAARSVVVATGSTTSPRIPSGAAMLDPAIVQVHTSDYRNPDTVPSGDVIVVGAGTSGVDIAVELAGAGHRTWLAGNPTLQIPEAARRFAGPLLWGFLYHVMTLDTPVGRRAAGQAVAHGAPLMRLGMKDVAEAGIGRLPRFSGVRDGLPWFGTDEVLTPSSIVWATGFRIDVSWLPPLETDLHGNPVTVRGIVEGVPGLTFVGLPFQYSITSPLIGGVGRDAAYVADRVAARRG
ncbi:flavin-containing monooxygenase [Raineyella fluvialis]|uniref:SidA/IucD/PvdA family monooxygenase n=1 Tax=Raineyella fluvialis TaxID=2662261 RepID=A0A5Q2FCM4_9ACTN|nr:NAD(P)/FAD-dependent oxidoreductase [Raineyella fluvialis]QGF24672.1 SidA/IucD/PvdA family monooxygenase [Raineyella fluvialis]